MGFTPACFFSTRSNFMVQEMNVAEGGKGGAGSRARRGAQAKAGPRSPAGEGC